MPSLSTIPITTQHDLDSNSRLHSRQISSPLGRKETVKTSHHSLDTYRYKANIRHSRTSDRALDAVGSSSRLLPSSMSSRNPEGNKSGESNSSAGSTTSTHKIIVRRPEFRELFLCSICYLPNPDCESDSCGHLYHEQCINHHFQFVDDSTCPSCRQWMADTHLRRYRCDTTRYLFECNYCEQVSDITTIINHERIEHLDMIQLCGQNNELFRYDPRYQSQ